MRSTKPMRSIKTVESAAGAFHYCCLGCWVTGVAGFNELLAGEGGAYV